MEDELKTCSICGQSATFEIGCSTVGFDNGPNDCSCDAHLPAILRQFMTHHSPCAIKPTDQ